MDAPASRASVLAALATLVAGQARPHPLRIAVDGRTASGKTTLADELADALRRRARAVIRTSIDGFHRPKAARYARGRASAEGYYFDARDLAAIRRLLLDPLGPGGDRMYRTASFDLDRDEPIDQPLTLAAADAILIVDGTFLQRAELIGGWDFVIYIDTSEELAARRGMERDQDRLGGADATATLYAARYRPAFAIYEEACHPRESAHVIVDNEHIEAPRMTLRAKA